MASIRDKIKAVKAAVKAHVLDNKITGIADVKHSKIQVKDYVVSETFFKQCLETEDMKNIYCIQTPGSAKVVDPCDTSHQHPNDDTKMVDGTPIPQECFNDDEVFMCQVTSNTTSCDNNITESGITFKTLPTGASVTWSLDNDCSSID